MLPKKRRISRKEIENIVKGGKRLNSPHLLLYVLKKGSIQSQFSFSISKKVCPKASDRNKYRRRGYSIIQKNLERISSNHQNLFVFKKGSNSLKYEELEQEVLKLLYDSSVII